MKAPAVLVLATLAVLAVPASARAHPLGNFTINHHHAITVHPDRVDLVSVIDLAEIPTLQEQPARQSGYAGSECDSVRSGLAVNVDGMNMAMALRSASVEYPPGEAGLATTRLTCLLTAPADLGAAATVDVRDTYRPGRVGWHEMTAVGDGIVLLDPPVPATSSSDELRAYPDDLLSDPLDIRTVSLRVEPGTTAISDTAAARGGSTLIGTATRAFTGLVGQRDLTPLIGVLAVLLSLLLGASHAALPGHGKTVIAAYLAGRAGTARDAVTVGATVTLTHTIGVLLIGLAISASSALAGESLLRALGIVSGVLVTAIGAFLLRSALHRQPVAVGRGHGHGHAHGHGHGHSHGVGRGGLIGMGVAGGLVPSPSALVVLLGAIALGRTWFGVLLVLGYGLGMATTLTIVGLLLVRLRDRLASVERLRDRFTALPAITAGLVLVVGLGLTARALFE
ncbi:sulfite exporter TauE/SafE family protein [Lentzea sp. BCCO 10_0856]|uniref:Sulfite exporter TauE/SafE family protein n=1 Tax=Lentzea miocenica TaxID=3095431 RepID=A0ABU4TB91_9PSEU|nr:sulfite exporter TauE/SafE family protein [Lentzea sp. BCCO 10_0856]MDX8035428.1 sulfite exporter TauE/SafE family protein [Lentzea sp. BCCO 10_0856]